MIEQYNLVPLAEADWLEAHLSDADLRIVDLRYRPRRSGDRWVITDDRAAYEAGHVPGAVFAESTRGFVEPRHDGSLALAPPDIFAEFASRLGVGSDTRVVVYDDLPVPNAAARLWWTFRYYDHEKVHVLNGGFRKWRAEGRPVSTHASDYERAVFVPRIRSRLRVTKENVRAAIGSAHTVIVDCMPSDMHAGRVPRPWGARLGHIPGAVCVPWLANALPEDVAASDDARIRALTGHDAYCYRPLEELNRMYRAAGVSSDKRVITYCDLGYAASNAAFVLTLLGYDDVAVYDGSFAEWSSDDRLPVESSS